jgi:hypothetical protein
VRSKDEANIELLLHNIELEVGLEEDENIHRLAILSMTILTTITNVGNRT